MLVGVFFYVLVYPFLYIVKKNYFFLPFGFGLLRAGSLLERVSFFVSFLAGRPRGLAAAAALCGGALTPGGVGTTRPIGVSFLTLREPSGCIV